MPGSPAFPIYPISTLRSLVAEACARYRDKIALASKQGDGFEGLAYSALFRQTTALAEGLRRLGLQPGDRVALLSENRPEWALTYLAVVGSGLVVVPIDRDLKEREIRHILALSASRLLMTSAPFVRMLGNVREELKSVEWVVSMDADEQAADFIFTELVRKGELVGQSRPDAFPGEVEPDDLAAVIFTSGTTGTAKGVMLTHENLAGNVMAVSHNVAIDHDDVLLSVLPLHHTYECTAGFLTALYQGASIYYAESLRRIADNLVESRASVMLGVPALFEAMYRRIESGIKQRGQRRFRLAMALAKGAESVFRINIRRRMFKTLHEKFGGRLRLLICGGAAVDPEVARGYRALGINFIQGYGLTEHSPIISVNRVDHFKDASVGTPLPAAEVRIEKDEIVVRGPCVMNGYYEDEKATADAIRDGWLYTGDLGYLDQDGFLFVNGRRKSVIVTPNGKNVYPEEVESVLNQSPYILESLVWGGGETDPSKTEVQAILVPDTEALDREFGPTGYDEKRIQTLLSAEVKKCNQRLTSYKMVRKFQVRADEFEKTTTRKIKRYLYTGKTRQPAP